MKKNIRTLLLLSLMGIGSQTINANTINNYTDIVSVQNVNETKTLKTMKVKNNIQLQEALANNVDVIELENSISLVNSIKLNKGQKLIAKKDNIFLSFINGDGVALTGNNEISNISIQTSPAKRAIYIESEQTDLGEIKLNDLVVTGVVQLLTRGNNMHLSLNLKNIDIVSADARNFAERPMKYGVNVYQGALTIFNYNPAKGSKIDVVAENISVGRENAPVIGTGIFVSGFNDEAGPVEVKKLTTGNVYSNGMIPTGQPTLITGGIFIVYGAYAKEIVSNGEVVTYGTNDMVLDNWGKIGKWTVKSDVKSFGASGIGFVNFGDVDDFRLEKGITTYGIGARGFNQYDGTIKNAYFESIKTMADGSIGIQISKPVGNITIGSEISTAGSIGETLVKGVIKNLQADAISVLEGGEINKLEILGNIKTSGENVVNYHINGGRVNEFILKGKNIVEGKSSKDVVIENGGVSK